jgi:hypothetical protein
MAACSEMRWSRGFFFIYGPEREKRERKSMPGVLGSRVLG